MNDATHNPTPPVSARLRDMLATLRRSSHSGRFDRGVFDCDGMELAPNGEYVLFDDLEFDISAIAAAAELAEAEVLRLAGPPCDYPPCNGARAIEHAGPFCDHNDGDRFPHSRCTAHPPAPAIEQFLRERGGK